MHFGTLDTPASPPTPTDHYDFAENPEAPEQTRPAAWLPQRQLLPSSSSSVITETEQVWLLGSDTRAEVVELCQPLPRLLGLKIGKKPNLVYPAVTRPPAPPPSSALGHAEVAGCWGPRRNSPDCFILLARPPPPVSTHDSRSLPKAPSPAASGRRPATPHRTTSVWSR
ncbi:hypothetical protein J1605_020353 [Eschrichtius robustus]|uniref:Uncharacterized protein n=1 Tax=Eschrichtius robustus TaxID=9764 RepID=A0AB34HKW2_ESCRO|nr:hypothetical protein J1605_020353 [Eschrichtius robustus]